MTTFMHPRAATLSCFTANAETTGAASKIPLIVANTFQRTNDIFLESTP